MAEELKDKFTINLAVLNEFGKMLYRKPSTVICEAISNSWDADATQVQIYLRKTGLLIVDNGHGMTSEDFHKKFLAIGYNRRKKSALSDEKKRLLMGRKGLGKLALLSLAKRLHIISKINGGEFTGYLIDNSELDEIIENDKNNSKTPDDYQLKTINYDDLKKAFNNKEQYNKYKQTEVTHSIFDADGFKDMKQGTIIFLEDIFDKEKVTENFLKKTIALYFSSVLRNEEFKIKINNDYVDFSSLDPLLKSTEFIWLIDNFEDKLTKHIKKLHGLSPPVIKELKQKKPFVKGIKGFLATVSKPKDLAIPDTDEQVAVSLFVNGRLRVGNIFQHGKSARIVMNYLYGQIHYDALDGETDIFSTNREDIVNSKEYAAFKEQLTENLTTIFDEWDPLRRDRGKSGDPDNTSISPSERAAVDLSNTLNKKYESIEEKFSDYNKALGSTEFEEFQARAAVRKKSGPEIKNYASCFKIEGLLREFIIVKEFDIENEIKSYKYKNGSKNRTLKQDIEKYKNNENKNKDTCSVNHDIRLIPKAKNVNIDLYYAPCEFLLATAGKKVANLKDSSKKYNKKYTLFRNPVMHTASLTNEAAEALTKIQNDIVSEIENYKLTSPNKVVLEAQSKGRK